MGGRRACVGCGATYHLVYAAPKKDGICDVCGGELILRDDDKPETVEKRLHVYHDQTQPLIDYYTKAGILKSVDGTVDMEDVFGAIVSILGESQMPITIKSEREIELMTEAGRILGIVHKELEKALKPGMSTLDIDALGEEVIRSYGCEPSFLNYNGYPASICVSVNDEIVHGIPSAKHLIKEGDIVSLDAGVIYKGYHSDAARTHAVGEIRPDLQKLIDVTRESFFEGIKFAKEGNHLYDISRAIGDYAESFGYGVVRELCGHGIGTSLHESPEIPNFQMRRRGPKLKAGMTLAIEPMVNLGTERIRWMSDNWTVVTADRKESAHYENTILITKDEPKILSIADGNV